MMRLRILFIYFVKKQEFIVAGDDGIIKVYDLNNGDMKKEIKLSELSIMKLFIYNDRLFAIINDK